MKNTLKNITLSVSALALVFLMSPAMATNVPYTGYQVDVPLVDDMISYKCNLAYEVESNIPTVSTNGGGVYRIETTEPGWLHWYIQSPTYLSLFAATGMDPYGKCIEADYNYKFGGSTGGYFYSTYVQPGTHYVGIDTAYISTTQPIVITPILSDTRLW